MSAMPSALFNWILCLAFTGLGACNGASKSELYPQNKSVSAVSPRLTAAEMQQLLALYELQDSFPLQVSTKVGEWEGPHSKKFHWKGHPLPEKYWPVFDLLVKATHNLSGETYYATKSFRINKQATGLLTRVPGAYWSSQIYLVLLDESSLRLTGAYRVAESWADAADSYYLETKISKLRPGRFRLETHQQECHPRDDSYQILTCTDTLAVCLLQDKQFQVISRGAVHPPRDYPAGL